jgi:TrmH family RNA methyltransferase
LTRSANLGNLCIVLVRTRNPLNIGSAARVMSNFGAFDLRLVTPYEKAFREAVSAVGAASLLANAKEFDSVTEAVKDSHLVVGTTAIGNRELQHDLFPLKPAGKNIRTALERGRVAVLFGSEKTGLTNHELSHCHWLLRVPTREEHRSLNLAQAVAIVLYELSRNGRKLQAKSKLSERAAETETIERINQALREALDLSGYIHPRSAGSAEEKLRRMLRRFAFSAADAEVLLGMLRKILWQLKEGKVR